MKHWFNPRIGFLGGGFLLGTITTAGIWIGWNLWLSESDNGDTTVNVPPSASEDTRSNDLAKTSAHSSVYVNTNITSLEEISHIDSEFSRYFALYNFVLDANENQLLDLIEQAEELPSRFQYSSQRVLVQRLYAINPEFAVSQVENLPTGMVQFIFREWAQTDLANAIDRAKSLEGAYRQEANLGILSHSEVMSDEQRGELGRELGNERLAAGITQGQQFEEIRKDPESAWNDAVRNGSFDGDQVRTLIVAGTSWIRQNGLDVVDTISTSLSGMHVRDQVLTSVLVSATQEVEFEDVFEKTLELERDSESRMLSHVVAVWAETDPISAIVALEEVDSPIQRKNLLATAIHNWAHTDPRTVLEKIVHIPLDMQAIAQEVAIKTLSHSSPEEAISMMKDLKPGIDKMSLEIEIATNWAERDSQTAISWVMQERESPKRQAQLLAAVVSTWSKREPVDALDWVLDHGELFESGTSPIATILWHLAEEKPELALQRALEQPMEENRLGLEHTVISRVADYDYLLAKEMLQQTREGITKVNSFVAVGVAMLHASKGSQALDLAEGLSGSDRYDYEDTILSQWATIHPSGLFDNLSHIQDSRIQSKAAASLIKKNNKASILSDEQIELARKYITQNPSTTGRRKF